MPVELLKESYLYRLVQALCALWHGSFLSHLCGGIAAWCIRQWNGSVFAQVLCREGAVARGWKDSRLCAILSAIVNFPGWVLHKLYLAGKPAFDDSLFAKIAFEVGEETSIAQSWMIMLLWVIPFTYWNNAYNFIGFLFLLLLYYVRGMRNAAARLNLASVGFYPVLLFGAICLAFPLSAYPDLSARFVVYHATCALCVLVTASAVRSGEDLKRLAAAGGFVVLVSSAYGVYQRIMGVEVNASYVDLELNPDMPGRVESFFDNPNTFAEVLILLLPLLVALMFSAKHWFSRVAAAGIFAVGVAALGMTYSRASWVGIACAAVVFVFLWRPKLIPLFAAACILCIPLLPATIWHRILTIGNTSDSSTSSRIPLYQAALATIRTSPATGAGLGTAAVQQFIADRNLYHGNAPYVHAHNIYLELWVEAGVLGFVGFFASMMWNIKNAARQVRHCADSAARTITAASCAALCGARRRVSAPWDTCCPSVFC